MKPRQSDGFTLIEVLIAFAILALVLGAVFRSFSTGLSSERRASLAVARALEARSVLEDVGAGIPLEPGQAEGELSTGDPWTLTIDAAAPVEGLEDYSNYVDAFRVAISVRNRHGEALSLTTIKLRLSEK